MRLMQIELSKVNASITSLTNLKKMIEENEMPYDLDEGDQRELLRSIEHLIEFSRHAKSAYLEALDEERKDV